MKHTSKLLILVSIVLSAMLFTQCDEDSPLWLPDTPVVSATFAHGIVTDTNNQPLEGVTVSSVLHSTTTDANGIYNLEYATVIRGFVHLKAEKEGYFTKQHNAQAQGEHTTVQIMISPKSTQMVSATTANTVTVSPRAQVELPANGLVDASGNPYTGMVEVASIHYSPDDDFFELLMPGVNFRGIDESGEDMLLISYGVMGVELTSETGEALQIADGQTATIRMTIPDEMLAEAPASIPLWHFDEAQATWIEEGSAAKIGNEYVGEVSHFSWWNCDVPVNPKTSIQGLVVDCNGSPLAGIPIVVGPLLVYTNDEGWYATNVAVGIDFQVFISPEYTLVTSTPLLVGPLAENDNIILDDLILPCVAHITGNLVDCDANTIAGTVHASWDGGQTFIYSDNGTFDILVAGNEVINLSAVAADFSQGTATITSIPEQITALPTAISVCGGGIGDCPFLGFVGDGIPQLFNEANGFTASQVSIVPFPFIADSIMIPSGGLGIKMTDGNTNIYIFNTTDTPGVYPIDVATEFQFDKGIIGTDVAGNMLFWLADGNLTLLSSDANGVTGTFEGGATSINPLLPLLSIPTVPLLNMTEGQFCIEF